VWHIVQFFYEYVDFHFGDEEKLLQAEGYPKYAEHKKLHDAYKAEFADIGNQLAAHGFTAAIMIRIQDKVVNWLLEHIAKVDHDYAVFIADKYAKQGIAKKA